MYIYMAQEVSIEVLREGNMCPLNDFSSLHYCCSLTVCVSPNCSLDWNEIGVKGGVALGETLTVNQTLQTLR